MKLKAKVYYLLPYGPDLIFDKVKQIPITPSQDKFIFPKKRATRGYKRNKTKKHISVLLPCFLFLQLVFLFFLRQKMLPYDGSQAVKQEKGSYSGGKVFDPDSVPDYALQSAGARIFDEPTAATYDTQHLKIPFLGKWAVSSDMTGPQSVLQPWRGPGECWAFGGHEASIRIQLSHTIIPQAVTVEHIPKHMSPTGRVDSAPRHFSVFAVENDGSLFKEFLGRFEYREAGPPNQTFMVHPEGGAEYPARIIEFVFHSNHGQPHYTCVYKLRVHGTFFKL